MGVNRFHVISPWLWLLFRLADLVKPMACASSQTAVGGAVLKGPLNNAFVFLDTMITASGMKPASRSETDQFGEYELFATQNDYTLIAVADDQTVDTSSAQHFGYYFKSALCAEVTPTTTLMEEGNISAEEVATV